MDDCRCPVGEYDVQDDAVCKKCNIICETCTSKFDCVTCKGHRALSPPKCPCKAGEYDKNDATGECHKCDI